MKIHTIKVANKKTVKIFSFLDEKIGRDKYEIFEKIANKIPEINGRYCGYRSKEHLKYHLDWIIFGHGFKKIRQKKINEIEIVTVMNEVLSLCSDIINNSTYIFVFPNSYEEVIKKMNGVSGYNPYRNVVSISLYKTRKWKNSLKETIVHELAHASSFIIYSSKNTTLGEALILEGIAEHFRESKLGKNKSPWIKAISRNKILNILRELKLKLNWRDDYILHGEIFFGTGKYPNWVGYSIGYYLVGKYLKKQKNINWKKIIKTPPKKILREVV